MNCLSRAFLAIACAVLLLSVFSCSTAVARKRERSTYVHCNIYVTSACFGIGQGDQMQMTIPADYALYDVKLGDGSEAVIYSGYDPSLSDHVMKEQFDACVETDKVCSFVKGGKAKIEAVYSGRRQDNIIHILITKFPAAQKSRVHEFIDNFRPCRREGQSLICEDAQMIASP